MSVQWPNAFGTTSYGGGANARFRPLRSFGAVGEGIAAAKFSPIYSVGFSFVRIFGNTMAVLPAWSGAGNAPETPAADRRMLRRWRVRHRASTDAAVTFPRWEVFATATPPNPTYRHGVGRAALDPLESIGLPVFVDGLSRTRLAPPQVIGYGADPSYFRIKVFGVAEFPRWQVNRFIMQGGGQILRSWFPEGMASPDTGGTPPKPVVVMGRVAAALQRLRSLGVGFDATVRAQGEGMLAMLQSAATATLSPIVQGGNDSLLPMFYADAVGMANLPYTGGAHTQLAFLNSLATGENVLAINGGTGVLSALTADAYGAGATVVNRGDGLLGTLQGAAIGVYTASNNGGVGVLRALSATAQGAPASFHADAAVYFPPLRGLATASFGAEERRGSAYALLAPLDASGSALLWQYAVGNGELAALTGGAHAYLDGLPADPTQVEAAAILPIWSGSGVCYQTDLPVLDPAQYQAWVTNLRTGETTRFPGFGFIHLLRIGSSLYGIKPDGLYRMGGTEGVAPHVKLTPTDFEDEQTDGLALKALPYLYTDGNDSEMTVTAYADGVRTGSYASTRKSDRTRLARGPRGRVWQVELKGSRINLLRIGALVEPTKRRI